MRVYLRSVGCRLNQSEIESMAAEFRAAGHEIVADAGTADLAVVNTCAVTNAAVSDSRLLIRKMARAGVSRIVPTGCWVTLEPDEAAALPNVVQVVTNLDKNRLVTDVLGLPLAVLDRQPISREPLPGLQWRTRAFIKAQDGCDNRCTFCITTVARGKGLSRTEAEVIEDVRYALRGGVNEVVLTGVHLGSWGKDFGSHLRYLVRALLQGTDVPRLRLSSLEPWDLDERFFTLWENTRMMPHLHLPLQSGCTATLKRMARKTTPASFRKLVSAARHSIPDVAITTDIIAGFPGETAREFQENLEFVREMNFSGGHVFTYSARPGSAAAKMSGQVDHQIRKQRNSILCQTLEESARAYRKDFIGRCMSVLWEADPTRVESGWQLEGLSNNYLRVSAFSPMPRWNQINLVRITAQSRNGLEGVILNSG